MARPLRIEYPGAIYHVLSRGDRREAIFRHDADRKLFLELLAKTCRRTGWQIHAYCLMDNHFHLVVETPRSNLSAGMQWLLGSYTQQFNRRHGLWGHLFGGRYKALLVDARGGGGYLRQVCDYVHLNPVRAAILSDKERVHRYRWSSCANYLTSKSKRPVWLRTDRLMGEHGLWTDRARNRREFSRRMESLRQEANHPQLQPIRRGWKLGGEDFLDWILDKIEVPTKEAHPGRERDETEQAKAWRIVQQELKRRGWTRAELKRRRKGDKIKVALARRLREETAVSLRWIAENLHMGTWTHVSNRLYHCTH